MRATVQVLVVDDEQDLCWTLEKGLADDEVRVTPVHRVEDAIREVQRRSFDAAIVDVRLPGKNGIELSRAFRQLDPRLKILLISGYHYEEDQPVQEEIRRGGCQGFISKPFELDEVAALLRRIIAEGLESPSLEPVNGPEGQTERR